MLRGFRGTVFYNRCRQPPHVRTILSLAFTRYPSYTYVYTAYEQRLFPFLVVGRGRTWDPRALPHRSHIVDCRVFLISPKSEKETLGLEIFPPPSPPLHPTGNGLLFVFPERQERLFFLSLPPLPRKRAKNWTRRTKGRRARGEGIHRGEVWRARCQAVVVEGFSKETYGGLYSVYTRGRLKSIFPARSGPQQNQRNNGSADVYVHDTSTKITGGTARDLIQSSFLFPAR